MKDSLLGNGWPGTDRRVACFSVAAMDYFPQLDQYHAGGNALNQAVRFSDFGFRSSFIGAIGGDLAAERIGNLLVSHGVDVSHLYRLEGLTASNRIVNDSLGERFGVEGAWDNGVYNDFLLSDADWEYIADFGIWSTHANGRNYASALEKKRDHNFLVVDFLHFDSYELLEAGKDAIDIAYFGGTASQIPDLQDISKRYKLLVVLTLGAEGSIAFYNGEAFSQAALPLEQVVDTTGCGDAFQCGFTAAFYDSGDIAAALLCGAQLGRKAAMHYGGVSDSFGQAGI